MAKGDKKGDTPKAPVKMKYGSASGMGRLEKGKAYGAKVGATKDQSPSKGK